MGYQIDFLAVGEESKGGDAIAIRYGNLHGPRSEQTVIVIDGGYTASGERLVEHIKTHYGTDHVDIVVSTHPDQDHVCGLEVVLEELSVGHLLMHQSWKHSGVLAQARQMAFKSAALNELLEKSLEETSGLEAIATRKGIQITEPFTGVATSDGIFKVLGPSQSFYEEMLGNFQSTELTRAASSILEAITKALRGLVPESLRTETLREGGKTSPQNNTSVISQLTLDGERMIFTGDAGIPSLSQALDVLEAEGWQQEELKFVQIPHHGSRHNVAPSVLDRLLGPILTEEQVGYAYVSAPAKNPEHKHPSKKVLNAFRRRGYHVFATQGKPLLHHKDSPSRVGYAAAVPFPLYSQVEDDGDD